MAEAVVVLMPDMAGQEIVQRGNRSPPRNIAASVQPFRMLVEHRIHDVDERLVAGKKSVPAREEVALEPALAGMLGQDFHDPAIPAKMDILRQDRLHPRALGNLENVLKPVRSRLVRADDAEVARVVVGLHHRAQEVAHHLRRFRLGGPGLRNGDRMGVEDRGSRGICAAARHWHAGWRSCGARRLACVARISATGAPAASNSSCGR